MKKLQSVCFDQEKYIYLSLQQSHQIVFELAQKINKKIASGKMEKPEIIVGIARGALAWVKTLADWLNIDEIAIIRAVHYKDVGQKLEKPTILRTYLPLINRKRILLFDNVVETGKTMQLTFDCLDMHGAEKISSAVLFYKKGSAFKPDFYCSRLSDWIIFHFDILETVKLLGARWLNQSLSLQRIKQRLLKIGLPAKEVQEALKIIFNF